MLRPRCWRGIYPAIQGALLVLVAMVMAVNFIVDVAYYVLEPRIQK